MVSDRAPPNEDGGGTKKLTDTEVTVGDCQVSISPAVLELDHVFSALSHSRRRYLMYALAENPEWTLTDLATKLVAYEEGVDEAIIDGHRRNQMYASLYHTHIPKLVDEGIVTFDSDTETIARAEHATQVLAVLSGAGASLDQAQEQHANRAYDGAAETDT